MIPILYDSNESAFASNGLCRLRDVVSCVVTEERNGIYECDFEYPVNGANYNLIQCGRIIAVVHDETGDVQPFEIVSCTRPIERIVSFHAVHISYRQSKMTVSGTNINSLADAFTLLGTATPNNPFSYWSDKTSSGAFTAANGVPHSVRQMLGGMEGSILDCYGGEYEWDKWQVKLWAARGITRDFDIRYGVNLVGYEEEIDYSDTYTSCIPFWAGDDGNGGQTIVKGNKVSTEVPSYNGKDACIPLDLTDKFETPPTRQQLESMASSIMANGSVYVPAQTITVEFVRLQDSPEYEQYSALMECRLCDSVNVIFPDYDISRNFKIVRTVYDVLEERFTEMELGQLSTTLSEALGISTDGSSGGAGGGGGGADPSTTLPIMDGIAAIGIETKYARGDHVHPSDTSRVPTTREVNGYELSTDITLTASDVGAQEPLVSGTNIKTVNGNSILGSGNLSIIAEKSTYTGTSSTAAGTAYKEVTGSPTFVHEEGNMIAISFTNANTVEGMIALAIDSTVYHPVYVNRTVTSATNTLLWNAGQTVLFQCRAQGPQYVYEFIAKVDSDIVKATNTTWGGVKVQNGNPEGSNTYMGVIYRANDSIRFPTLDGLYLLDSSVLPLATTTKNGAMSYSDKTKIDGIESGAEVNVLDGVQLNGSDLTITNKKVNVPVMIGATSSVNGAVGLVPKPLAGEQATLLFGNGTWDKFYVSTSSSGVSQFTADIEKYTSGDVLASITIPGATTTKAGVMTAADRTKLNSLSVLPVGSVYESTSSTNPTTDLGNTWTLLCTTDLTSATAIGTSGGDDIVTSEGDTLGFGIVTYKFERTA